MADPLQWMFPSCAVEYDTSSRDGAPDISRGRFTQRIMAQTNISGQGTNGVADESPNMIVYRK
ncbi:hypothetical protein CCH79_00001798, partial [Gambusia affinis]